jgi:hypothetical protein
MFAQSYDFSVNKMMSNIQVIKSKTVCRLVLACTEPLLAYLCERYCKAFQFSYFLYVGELLTVQFKKKFLEIKEEHEDFYFIHIYTDGSNGGCKVQLVFGNNFTSSMMLPDNASTFTAEAKAIDLALSYIVQHIHDKFVIFSDSLSVLITIKNKKSHIIMIQKLFYDFMM